MQRQVPGEAKVEFMHGRCLLHSEKMNPVFWKRREGESPNDRIIWSDLNAQNVGLIMSPNGGVTECIVTFPDGTEIAAVAECSLKDNYCKKIGRDIALGRALKTAESKFPELFKAKETA